jgi:hypothetical protein
MLRSSVLAFHFLLPLVDQDGACSAILVGGSAVAANRVIAGCSSSALRKPRGSEAARIVSLALATSIAAAGRILIRVGSYLDESLSQRVYDAVVRLPLTLRSGGDFSQPVRDLDQIRAFLSSGGPGALADLPWVPLYLAVCLTR